MAVSSSLCYAFCTNMMSVLTLASGMFGWGERLLTTEVVA